jgi:hypothetical protein
LQEAAFDTRGEAIKSGSGESSSPTDSPSLSSPAAPVGPDATERDLELAMRLSSGEHPQARLGQRPTSSAGDSRDDLERETSRISWPFLLVASYASALTLALIWILVSGRSLISQTASTEPDRQPAGGRPVDQAQPHPAPLIRLPEDKLTSIGTGVRLGDLEVTPLGVAHGIVELLRLQGNLDDHREAGAALSLTVEIKNISRDHSFPPLESSLVRDQSPGDDQPCLELADGRRIALFRLAPESEWSIVGESFPTLKPGQSFETRLVTEPVSLAELNDPLIWHLKLRITPFQTDVLGVRLSRSSIQELEP